MIKFIKNIGDYFSSNYFDEDFAKKVFEKSGYSPEDIKEFQKKISSLKDKYFRLKQTFIEGKLRSKDKITETHKFHSSVLNALGYEGDKPEYNELFPIDENTVLPIRHKLYRGDKAQLMIMEMQALITVGNEAVVELFEQSYSEEEDGVDTPAQKYHRSQWSNVFTVPDGVKISPMIIYKAVSKLFLIEKHLRPRYILLCAGNRYYLLEEEKWFKGSYLQFDIEDLFDETSIKKDYYSLFYFLLSKETLAPQSDVVLMDQLDEDSHKSAFEVTKDLKEGVIHAVEALANEAIYSWNAKGHSISEIIAEDLKNDCLTMVYRLLFLFYAESREELDILPSNDETYQYGYSLELLRDLEQVPLNTASSQNGYFFNESLKKIFSLLSSGYREKESDLNRSFEVRHIDSPLFDDSQLVILSKVNIRNVIWQDIICQLSLSRKQKGKSRGRISYANLGINQLGSVYESLLAFRGFFADSDHIEVHKKRKATDSSKKIVNKEGSFLVPRSRMDDFDPLEVYCEEDEKVRIIPKGTFVYRLSGRDRKNSASFYTPEVLTQCTVKYTLKPILEKLDNQEISASELLNLKILEPAMGAAAFHNEVVNQLASLYIDYKQKEKKEKISPDKYQEEVQKVKAYIALNNVYGVDLNPTAIELGKLSLWLNVIHKDMHTPFFGYRLGVGNAVVGAWLKVYKHKDFSFEPIKLNSNTSKKKEWWTKAPKHLKYKNGKLDRKVDEIYHFLLPDKGMLPSAGIKLLKNDFTKEAKEVTEWRKVFCTPLRADEYERVQLISKAIDQLLEDHYKFQSAVNVETRIKGNFFGAYDKEEQSFASLKSFNEKEKLAAERNTTNAPYYKLKLIMDYWCALWFWDVREAKELPTRGEWYDDIMNIINIDFSSIESVEESEIEDESFFPTVTQGNLFGEADQLSLKTYKKDSIKVNNKIADFLKTKSTSLFINRRNEIIRELSNKYKYFHYQLEFIEVFKERGGFDLAVGNPPWLKLTFEEKGLMSEVFPELEIRSVTAPKVKELQSSFLKVKEQKDTYFEENIGIEAASVFMNAYQNYPLLKGQQTNLYKCVLENGFNWISEDGYLGLLHPESVYDDPKGQALRKEIYSRLKYHFQFQNAFNLFAEVAHREKYASNIYSGKKTKIDFISINNLFNPSTIDACFIHNGSGDCGGIKTKDESSNSFKWNLRSHKSRIVHFGEDQLKILAKTFEDSDEWKGAKLVSIHTKEILSAVEKLGQFPNSVKDFESIISVCWDETIDLTNGNIRRETKYPNFDEYEMIYSGPHIFVSNPLYKTPRKICKEKADYDIVELDKIENSSVARTNYIPLNVKAGYADIIKGFKIGKDKYDSWFDYYKIGFRKMLSQAGERTLTGAILPPKTAHIYGLISITFRKESYMIEAMSLTSSIVLDFFMKTIGSANLTDSRIKEFPLGIEDKYKKQLFARTLLLNSLNKYYAPLWERNWQEEFIKDQWSINDLRLKPFNTLTKDWKWETPLRNWFERRQALVEIDVISAMALGLTLEELILIYNVQFPVLQQNEDDTWYDTKGNIVFTCSKGLSGVGLDRAEWNNIKNYKVGDIYKHTIEKSELYKGNVLIYYAPFNKCDRIEDYKIAWEHFEKVFNK